MTPSDDHSPPRRPIFFPVVIATVFLTIIGLTAGFVLGERRNAARPDAGETTTPPADPAPPTGKPCPPEAIRTAAALKLPTDLRQVMRVVTDNGTTVWICTDPEDGLYYQSKTGGINAELEQGVNGLFLSQVERVSGTQFRAVSDDGNRFTVTRSRLTIAYADGRKQENDVVVWE